MNRKQYDHIIIEGLSIAKIKLSCYNYLSITPMISIDNY